MKQFKNFITLLLILIIILSSTGAAYAEAPVAPNQAYLSDMTNNGTINWPKPPEITGEAAIVMEASTGTIFYSKNINQTMYPSSLTTLATALLALENASLEDMVYFSSNAVFSIPKGSGHIAINPGEYLSLEHCIYGMLMASACEVANALAEHVSGTTEKFAKLMNERLKVLGAINTNFVNAHGGHDENHYTTCYDMAMLCRELINNKSFLELNKVTSYTIPPTNLQPLKRPINSTHMLLRKGAQHYDGCFGGKTGYSSAAGNTLVTLAERDGMTLICVVMKSDSSHIYSDTTSLLDYGFTYFKKIEIAKEENSFNFLENSLSTNSDLFYNPNPHFELTWGDYVYIPTTISFSDLEYTLIPRNDSTIFADLIYTYKGHFVGQTTLNIIENTTTPPNTSSSDDEATDKVITILVRPIHFIIAGVVLIILIIYIVYLKVTQVERMRKRAIRQRNRMHRKRNKLH